ncbi:MAG: single-stranded DNA-binding protein [Candidatus Marinimicrobia bacterium]|jgi:single-strand DNA-binding protein|nr:single-stranded DNA-binding protein [Candidatus Neomarinimicrobiota bacterium]MDP6568872.1 single-stranded DNA-binding protein [Candidatus Neomarinimicrobiota bacterium]MDP7025922.1 single-stranded DNA-binding protein [Candidatus Neomarinimicrobiota bacterium]|tara:strand:+ start:1434 stop:1841 length:408 start_codon:yes stop_codon:yes gene_type:complete
MAIDRGSVNKTILIGHLGSDPESRYLPSGDAVLNFSVATNTGWRDKEGVQKDQTEWHRCVLFGKQAENAVKLFAKGKLVYLDGRLRTRSWEDKDGIKRYQTEVVVNNFTLLGGKGKESSDAPPQPEGGDEDDLPF